MSLFVAPVHGLKFEPLFFWAEEMSPHFLQHSGFHGSVEVVSVLRGHLSLSSDVSTYHPGAQ